MKAVGWHWAESLGIGKGSVKLEDLYEAEVIMILGQNPGTNHPRMLTALQKAKANGATIISINPLPETGLMGFNNPQQVKGILGIEFTIDRYFFTGKNKWRYAFAAGNRNSYCWRKKKKSRAQYLIMILLNKKR